MSSTATRRQYLTIAGVGLTGTLAGCLDAGDRDATDEPLSGRLDERVPELLDYYDVPGACIALVEGGEVTWTGAYGDADREEGRPMTAETVFRVASITNSVTAWGVMNLVEEGEIGLDDPVERHVTRWELPDTEFDTSAVTVRRLLSHTSGLQLGMPDDDERYAPDEALPAPEEVLAGEGRERAARFERPPGTEFSYSSAGYAVLELLIEEVTGRDYEAYMREEILTPLGMADAAFTRDEEVAAGLASGYTFDGERGPVFVDPIKASGGLYATAGDVARFVAAASAAPDNGPPGGGVLLPESVAELYAPVAETSGLSGLVSDAYGLGHYVETAPDGEPAVWHWGQHVGWLSHYHCVPGTGDGIVVLTNSERSQRFLADVIGAWTDAQGLSAVAMSWIYPVIATGVRATMVGAGLGSAWLGWRLGRGLRSGDRRFAPLARESVGSRVALGGFAVLIMALWWVFARDVLVGLLPVLSGQLAVAISVFAVVAVALALFPRVDGD